MRHSGCTEKLQKYGEEVKQFEQELEERHRRQMQEEMCQYLESLDPKASEEVVQRGGYESKGLMKRSILIPTCRESGECSSAVLSASSGAEDLSVTGHLGGGIGDGAC